MRRRRSVTLAATFLTTSLVLAPGTARAQIRYQLGGNAPAYSGPVYGAPAYGGGYPVYPPGLINNPAINNPYIFRDPVAPVLYGLGDPTGMPALEGTSNFFRPLTGFTGTGSYASPLYTHGVPGFASPQYAPGPDLRAYLLLTKYDVYNPAPAEGSKAGKETGDRAARVRVTVPAGDAEIWFQGQKTKRTGKVREFQSPPLTPGVNYTYEIRARWRDGDRSITQTRTVPVRAGQHVQVDFTARPN
jgi:uncharacterized protein (TIGR03000 family)